jgi:platelet-activating factor acetylhydrolase IB subunit beta/gamma
LKSYPFQTILVLFVLSISPVFAIDYPYQTDEPQKTGWPLNAEERAYVMRPEHDRRPGREANKHLPAMWPVVPSAGNWGGTSWLDTHARLVEQVRANAGPCDVLLVGDSITIQWGDAWKKHFPNLKAINIGIGGDKTQNVLWRLDHGGVEGLQPKLILLMIGNNNMFFTPETGIESVAKGIEMCMKNLCDRFPKIPIIVAKILPAHEPNNRFYEDIKKTNAALDPLNLESNPNVFVLDMWNDFTTADGKINKELFTSDNIHLSPAGYAAYANLLHPLIHANFNGEAIPQPNRKPKLRITPETTNNSPSPPSAGPGVRTPRTTTEIELKSSPVLSYPYKPYNQGKLDPQLTGWPLSEAELGWVQKPEYTRKPGHEAQKHLPEFWFVTPTASHWQAKDGSGVNEWVEHHAQCVGKAQAMREHIDIAIIGDSITQGWGGGWDGSPFNTAWQNHFGDARTVNLGIGGDRMEHILWRLDHGALEGTSPRCILLMIGVNNAPLVQANGVPMISAAQGIKLCVENLRLRCPDSRIVLVKILPAFDPSKEVGAEVRKINQALDDLRLESDAKVKVLDLWNDFTNVDGSLKSELYSDRHLHLNAAGYGVFASKLKPAIMELLERLP